jgi:hypothetical protein
MRCKHCGREVHRSLRGYKWEHTTIPYVSCTIPNTKTDAEALDFKDYYEQIINIKTNLK